MEKTLMLEKIEEEEKEQEKKRLTEDEMIR